MGEPDQGKLQLSLEQIQQALSTLNQFQEAAVRQVLDQMAGKMRQMEGVIRALQAQVPPPEPPEDEETAKLRIAREQFVANQKLREAPEPPAPRLPDPNQVFDARLRSVEVALAEVRDYMARSVTTVTQQMPPPTPATVAAPPVSYPPMVSQPPSFYNPMAGVPAQPPFWRR